jgi:DNA-binding PadR family transcriptional regulator
MARREETSMYAHAMFGPPGAGHHHHGHCGGGKFEHRGGPPFAGFFAAMGGGGPRGHRGPRGGRGPWGGFGGPGFGPPPGFGRGGRRRRGDVRAALLVLLDEGPRNGYQLMQEIEERSNGAWRPSPGSVYPALQQLQDEGLVAVSEEAERRAFGLTDAGRAYVAEHRESLGTPWEQPGDEDAGELRSLMMGVGAALFQVLQTGTEAQQAEARKILAEARKALYRILAEEED